MSRLSFLCTGVALPNFLSQTTCDKCRYIEGAKLLGHSFNIIPRRIETLFLTSHLIWAVSRPTNLYLAHKIDISTIKTRVFFSKLSSNIQLVPIRTILLCRNMYHVASVDIASLLIYIYKTKAELDLTSLYCFLLFSIPCYIFFCSIRKKICLSILLKFYPNNL